MYRGTYCPRLCHTAAECLNKGLPQQYLVVEPHDIPGLATQRQKDPAGDVTISQLIQILGATKEE